MGPVLTAFLDDTPLDTLGADAEQELRADLADYMASTARLIAAWDDAIEQYSQVCQDLDEKGREYAGSWDPDPRLLAGLRHIGWAYSRAQQAIAHVNNLMRSKAWGAK